MPSTLLIIAAIICCVILAGVFSCILIWYILSHMDF